MSPGPPLSVLVGLKLTASFPPPLGAVSTLGWALPGSHRKCNMYALFYFHMLKLMCHCEDSKQMGKGQGFFVAKCVSMATAICVHHQKA